LIDEALQRQEATRSGVSVTNAELDRAVTVIEEQRGRPPGSLIAFLQSNKIPIGSFRDQVEAQLGWNKLVGRLLRRNVRINESEVEQARQMVARNQTQNEVNVAAIQLPIAKPEEAENIKNLAQELAQQVHDGASFEAVATQFSSQSVRESGSKPQWLEVRSLPPEVALALEKLRPGQITTVIETVYGYQIFKLYDRRKVSARPPDAEVVLKQILLSLKPTAQNRDAQEMFDIAKRVSEYPGTCEEKGIAGIRSFDSLDIDVELSRMMQSNLSEEVQAIVKKLKVGGISEPFATIDGINLLMLCERIDMPAALPDREQIRQVIFRQKLELEAEKHLRNLRREAFIEVRA
jgi:peptidyl-prolyl cis-trans isomerase SurA